MRGFRFESSNAKLQVSNGVCGDLRNLVSTPRVGPMTCKPSLQTVYRRKTREKRPFERYKMSVVNTISTLPWCNVYMGAAHTFSLSHLRLRVAVFKLSFANAKITISEDTCIS